jgi:hypothetical protein
MSGQEKRFRSSEEFLPHAWWLQQDPSSPCGCLHHPEITLPSLPKRPPKEPHTDPNNKSPEATQIYWTCLKDSITSRGPSPAADSQNVLGNDDDDNVDDNVDELDELGDIGKTDWDILNGNDSDDSAEMKEVEIFLLDVNAFDHED